MKAAFIWLVRPNRACPGLAGLVCLPAFLALLLLVNAAPLHRAAHADATAPAHHCVITLFTQGQLNAPDVAPAVIVFIAALFFLPPLTVALVLPSIDHRLSPGRAPPRS